VAEDQPPTDIDALLHEVMANSNPVQHGPDFDHLVALVEEELGAQIAIESLGQIEPPATGIHDVAFLVADMVDHVYLLERRARPWSNRTTSMVHGMYATFEHDTDMAYIYLTNAQDARTVAHTEPLVIDLPIGHRRLINLDFDEEGRLLGIEVDGARTALPKSLLAEIGPNDK
jgi:uncharacterized protein YuzE